MEIDVHCDCYSVNSFNLNLDSSHSSDFKLLHVNIRSLRKNSGKLVELLSTVSEPFDIICLSETFLYKHEENNFPISNYVFTGSSRPSRAGGVGAYVRNDLIFKSEEIMISGAEASVFYIESVIKNSILITTVIYRRPSRLAADLDKFYFDLDRYLHSNKHAYHIVTGDININILSPNASEYLDIMHLYNFSSLISIPTRVTTDSSTCIDHLYANFSHSAVNSGTIITDVSDHYPIFGIFKTLNQTNTNAYDVNLLCHRSLDKNLIVTELGGTDWGNLIYSEKNLDTCCTNMIHYLQSLVSKSTCHDGKSKNRRSKPKFPWINKNLMFEINKKNNLFNKHRQFPFSPKLKTRYHKQRNKVTWLLKEA